MSLEEYKGVFIFAQQVDNEITPVALELLGKANPAWKQRKSQQYSSAMKSAVW